jgi:hypothetical protein
LKKNIHPSLSDETKFGLEFKLIYNPRMTDRKLKDYRLLAERFRSDQFTSKDMKEEFDANPEFKDWYFKNYIGVEKLRSL